MNEFEKKMSDLESRFYVWQIQECIYDNLPVFIAGQFSVYSLAAKKVASYFKGYDVSDDLMQESLMLIQKCASSFDLRTDYTFAGYLYECCKKNGYNYLRTSVYPVKIPKDRFFQEITNSCLLSLPLISGTLYFEQMTTESLESEFCFDLHIAMDMLKKSEQELMILIMHGYSAKEISSILHCSERTVKRQKNIIFKKLKEKLKE